MKFFWFIDFISWLEPSKFLFNFTKIKYLLILFLKLSFQKYIYLEKNIKFNNFNSLDIKNKKI